MNAIKGLSVKKSIIIFTILCVANLAFSVSLFFFIKFPEIKAEANAISDYVVKNIEEKKFTLKISKDVFEVSPEETLFESKDFPIDFGKKNLLFISKNANYADFSKRETLAILNPKELVIDIDGQQQSYLITDFIEKEAYIDSNSVKDFLNQLDVEGSRFKATLLGALGFERVLLYISHFIWGYAILPFAVFYLMKFSGYVPNKDLYKILGTLFYGLFILFEPFIVLFKININFIQLLAVGFLLTAFIAKKELDN